MYGPKAYALRRAAKGSRLGGVQFRKPENPRTQPPSEPPKTQPPNHPTPKNQKAQNPKNQSPKNNTKHQTRKTPNPKNPTTQTPVFGLSPCTPAAPAATPSSAAGWDGTPPRGWPKKKNRWPSEGQAKRKSRIQGACHIGRPSNEVCLFFL